MDRITADVAVLGAGAGGFGAVYRAAGNGLKVALIDRNPGFGGTSVYAGVNCWEPGVASGSAHARLAGILAGSAGACGVGRLDLGRLRTALGCEVCEAEFEKALG